MTNTIRIPATFKLLLPITLLASIVVLARSSWMEQQTGPLAFGITLDLLLTIPLVYYISIRKTSVPKLTVFPVLIGCLMLGTYILPASEQALLSQVKRYAIPAIELTVFTIIATKVYSLRKKYRENKQSIPDFYTALLDASRELLPAAIAVFLATEIAAFYYGFLNWKSRKLQANEFSYHKESGTMAILGALMLMITVETFVLHILIERWSVLASWIVSGLSIYTLFQVFGMLRSLNKRPISLTENQLVIRYGILGEAFIPYQAIEKVELSSKDLEFEGTTRHLSPLAGLESHNVVIHIRQEELLTGLYGKKQPFKILALHVDNPEAFKKAIEQAF